MSVNDPIAWIAELSNFVREAVKVGIPVIGHCLGGQLLSRALGGTVTRNPVKEIGWREVVVLDTPGARDWFGARRRFTPFHWHGETFSIPPEAERLAESSHCPHQAYAIGPHLGLQCHIEMTAPMVRAWCRSGAREIREAGSPAVQSPDEIRHGLAGRIAELNQVAGEIYDRWLQGVA